MLHYLDETLAFTKVACKYANEYKDEKDVYTDCYRELTPKNLFRTGRVDCDPKPGGINYLASRVENHPSIGLNGSRTIEFFTDNFGMNG